CEWDSPAAYVRPGRIPGVGDGVGNATSSVPDPLSPTLSAVTTRPQTGRGSGCSRPLGIVGPRRRRGGVGLLCVPIVQEPDSFSQCFVRGFELGIALFEFGNAFSLVVFDC